MMSWNCSFHANRYLRAVIIHSGEKNWKLEMERMCLLLKLTNHPSSRGGSSPVGLVHGAPCVLVPDYSDIIHDLIPYFTGDL